MLRRCYALVYALLGEVDLVGISNNLEPSIYYEEFGSAKLAYNLSAIKLLGVIPGVLYYRLGYDISGNIIYCNDDVILEEGIIISWWLWNYDIYCPGAEGFLHHDGDDKFGWLCSCDAFFADCVLPECLFYVGTHGRPIISYF